MLHLSPSPIAGYGPAVFQDKNTYRAYHQNVHENINGDFSAL